MKLIDTLKEARALLGCHLDGVGEPFDGPAAMEMLSAVLPELEALRDKVLSAAATNHDPSRRALVHEANAIFEKEIDTGLKD